MTFNDRPIVCYNKFGGYLDRFNVKTHRITTNTKPQDRFLISDVHTSAEEHHENTGTIFSLVEILNPWPAITTIGNTIINTCEREYYRGKESPSENFELSLKKVNETLAQYTQNGETDWIGNLNAVLALLLEDQLHITAVGMPYALLLRDGKFVNIIEEQTASNDIHPLHTFSNITSGELIVGDVVFIASSQTYEVIKKAEIKEILELNPIDEAAEILTENIRNTQYAPNITLFEICAKEDDTDTIETRTTYIDKIDKPISKRAQSYYKRNLSHRVASVNSFVSASASHLSKAHKYILPRVSNSLRRTSILCGSALSTASKKSMSLIKNKNNINSSTLTNETTNIPDKPIHIRHYKRNNPLSYIFAPFKYISQIAPVIKYRLFRLFQHSGQRHNLWRILAMILIVVLIVSIILKITNHRSNSKPTTAKFNIESLRNDLQSSDLLPTKTAISNLSNIIKISDTNPDNSTLRVLASQAQIKLDTLTRTERIVTFNNSTSSIANSLKTFYIKNKLYTLTSTGKIFSSPVGKTFSSLSDLPANDNQIVSATVLKNKVIILTNKQSLYQFNPTDYQISTVPNSSAWENATTITSYLSNLYFLDSSKNKLWKYTLSGNQYTEPIDYTPNKTTHIKNSISLAIDGSIYILRKDNKLTIILQNNSSSQSLTGFITDKQKLTDPISIQTNADTDYLYITESHRVAVFTKNGEFHKEYVFANNISIIDSFLTKNTLFLSTTNKVFSIKLD